MDEAEEAAAEAELAQLRDAISAAKHQGGWQGKRSADQLPRSSTQTMWCVPHARWLHLPCAYHCCSPLPSLCEFQAAS